MINYTAKGNSTTEWKCIYCTTVNTPDLVNCQSCFIRRQGLSKLTADDLKPSSSTNNKYNNFIDKFKSLISWKGKYIWDCPRCTSRVPSYLQVCTVCGTSMPPGLSKNKPPGDQLAQDRTSKVRPSHAKLFKDKALLNKQPVSKSGKTKSTFSTLSNDKKLISTTRKNSREFGQTNGRVTTCGISPSECLDDCSCLLHTPTPLSPTLPPTFLNPSLLSLRLSPFAAHHLDHHMAGTTCPFISNPSIQNSHLSKAYNDKHTHGTTTHTQGITTCTQGTTTHKQRTYGASSPYTPAYNSPSHSHKLAQQRLSVNAQLPCCSSKDWGAACVCWVCPVCGIFNFTITKTRKCYVCAIGQYCSDLNVTYDDHSPVVPPGVAMEAVLTHTNNKFDPPDSHTSSGHIPHSPCSPYIQDHTSYYPKLGHQHSRPTDLHSGWGRSVECYPRPHTDEGLLSPVFKGRCHSTRLIHSIRRDASARANQLYQQVCMYCQQV